MCTEEDSKDCTKTKASGIDLKDKMFVSLRIMLSHVNKIGKAVMVNVSDKVPTLRTAVAKGSIFVPENVYSVVENNGVKKGDVISVARLAGIMAAKKTSELIPLCHQLNLDHVNVDIVPNVNGKQYDISASVTTRNVTGVEMEALTAVNVSALTFYDMCKAISQNMVIGKIQVVSKTGGKSNFV